MLLGAGHTHLHVLRMWKMHPLPHTRLTCVSNQVHAAYSGMLPGTLAGDYSEEQMQIDLVRRCQAVGARLILADAVGLDRRAKQLLLGDRPPLDYDRLSIAIGSRPAIVAGIEHACSIKPMQTFLPRLTLRLAAAAERSARLRIVIVGGGAGGVEIACCLPAFVRRRFPSASIEWTLIDRGERLSSGGSPAAVRLAEQALDEYGYRRLQNLSVTEITAGGVQAESPGGDPQSLEADAVIWAVGAVAPELLSQFDLPHDEAGFLLTDEYLRSTADESVFIVGDSGTCRTRPHPKAGVYAVRQGPVLWENLQRTFSDRPLREWQPQRGFLSLLNTGDGRAILDYRGWVARGRWCWRLKDEIDRRFMAKHQDYEPADMRPVRDAPAPAMRCTGCGGKLPAAVLRRALARLENPASTQVVVGLEQADDVAVVRLANGASVVVTVDFFTAFLDDPYLVGRVAALNALSDLFAKGATPTAALAHVVLPPGPESRQEQMLVELLAGGLAEFGPSGVPIVGGHSIEGNEPILGFSLVGEHADVAHMRRKRGLEPGDFLVITKPLGTGVLLAAHHQARCPGPALQDAIRSMLTSNRAAAEVADRWKLLAVTDVTGFGLLGHLCEMLESSSMAAELDLDAIPMLPGAEELLRAGIESTLAGANAAAAKSHLPPEEEVPARQWGRYRMLFDPQTSGGLLMGVPEPRLDAVLADLRCASIPPAVIGRTCQPVPGSGSIRWRAARSAAEGDWEC